MTTYGDYGNGQGVDAERLLERLDAPGGDQ